MQKLWIVLASLWFASTGSANEGISNRCVAKDAPILYSDEFHLGCGSNPACGETDEQLAEKFIRIYDSGMRLSSRAEYDPKTKSYSLYYKSPGDASVVVPITSAFIQSITTHIETAIAAGYADHVFQADMGHSHLYIEESRWQKNYEAIDSIPKLYEAMFSDPSLRVLYHLSEMRLLLDKNKKPLIDEVTQFKFWHRNFIGRNDGTDQFETPIAPAGKGAANNVGELPGYRRYGGGFQISASKDGCFPFKDKKGEIRYFDISLETLPVLAVDDSGM